MDPDRLSKLSKIGAVQLQALNTLKWIALFTSRGDAPIPAANQSRTPGNIDEEMYQAGVEDTINEAHKISAPGLSRQTIILFKLLFQEIPGTLLPTSFKLSLTENCH